LKDFAFIFWELKRRAKLSKYGGYPCIGYPQADKLVPAFKRVGADIQTFEFCDYASIAFALNPEKDPKKEPFKTIGQKLQSDKVLIEWDGITSHRDYMEIFKWYQSNYEIYVIPHHALILGGSCTPAFEREIRMEVTKNSTRVIFQLEWERKFWEELEWERKFLKKPDKFITILPPTRTGIPYEKIEARKILGIKTKYAIICWGNYENKNYEDLIPWIIEWKDTSLLFVGSGNHPRIREIAKKHNVLRRVFFSPVGISDVDADLWFSASDICSYPADHEGTSTPTHVVGQGRVIVTKPFPPYVELEKVSGVVTGGGPRPTEQTSEEMTLNVKKITRELLLNEDKRKVFEAKSREYARNNSYENYAIKIGELMGFSYSKRAI